MPVDEAALIAAAGRVLVGARSSVVGVAVSGGGDSLALLHLMLRAAPAAGCRVEAATVDHRLRAESAEEARAVGALCRQWGIPHEVLVWQTPQGPGNLMERAGAARRGLLADWARRRGIGHVVLGHTADDQAETVLMGLARAAGLDGLSGMRRMFREGGVVFARPLLDIPRQHLRDYLAAQGIGWADDPSNDNPAFTRVRARRAMKALRPLGITTGRLAAVADHLASAQATVEFAVQAAARRVLEERAGAVLLDRDAQEPAEVQRRLVLAILAGLTAAPHPPRESELNRVLLALRTGKGATLRGVDLRPGGDKALLRREPRAVAGLTAEPGALWDGRWVVDGPARGGEEIRVLGAAGLRACPDWRATGLPRQVLEVTPAVWRGQVLVAAPSAGFGEGWAATCAPLPIHAAISH